MTWEQWLSVAALVLAVTAVVIGVLTWRALQRRTPSFSTEPAGPEDAEPRREGPPAVVFNPSKSADGAGLRALVRQSAAEAGLEDPLWYETTVDDPGLGQAREALERGASVVVAAGGDGTVRAVAEALAGTGVPMGLIPLGTGNLLARNLDLPLSSQREMVALALTGRDRAMDLGWLRTEPLTPEEAQAVAGSASASTARTAGRTESADAAEGRYLDSALPTDPSRAPGPPPDVPGAQSAHPPDKEHVFLVIGGLGFDAAMVSG
ncbi:acylglycerol kinase family protein, partial [Georgenia sp. 10Sc9-8]|nr:acylglycerol kinase family protein [Georgenia halotolerans]